jgi:hypothetical protein
MKKIKSNVMWRNEENGEIYYSKRGERVNDESVIWKWNGEESQPVMKKSSNRR